jgi:hypothetical protein
MKHSELTNMEGDQPQKNATEAMNSDSESGDGH